ncbi:MAG: hypothetical protein M1118_14150 [Chloroflexi bacterium]|nr:hypothetical protein [Chloroflexota bacterium]
MPVLLVALSSCGSPKVLYGVGFAPNTISPNGHSTDGSTYLSYTLKKRADITISFVAPDGQSHVLRDHQTRAIGHYALPFDGTYDNRVLPNGLYRFTVLATDSKTRAILGKEQATLTITNADTTPPQILSPYVFPQVFHPNGNLGTDTATFTYNLSKPAQVTIFAVGPQGNSAAQRYDVLYQEDEQAGPNQATWTGQISPEEYVPDGSYKWTILAKDAAGNVSEASGTLQVKDSGIADARIEAVRASEVDRSGQRLIEIQVRIYNYGHAVLYGDQESPAPQIGFVYDSLESTYLNPPPWGPGWGEEAFGRAGTYSVGVSFAQRLDTTPPPYPFRWSIGGPLAPRQSRLITGYIKIPANYHGTLTFYAGIIHEGQGILNGQDHIFVNHPLVLS